MRGYGDTLGLNASLYDLKEIGRGWITCCAQGAHEVLVHLASTFGQLFEPHGGGLTDAQVKTAYENNADTNAFTDAEQAKLAGITSISIEP